MKNGEYVEDNGAICWYRNNLLHREDGPAVLYSSGAKAWYYNGDLHRKNGPAIIYVDGSEGWFQDGVLHREDGPATVRSDGRKGWYIAGRRYENIKDFARTAKWTDKQLAEWLILNEGE